ncbi:MAG: phosphotransferase [Herpetosiphonaceae bacterium]|nr:phosphotransferase [Herpetosiphonaceae bacterium]
MTPTLEHCEFLWEQGDPAAALRLRFGWATLPAAVAALTAIVYTNYGLRIQHIDRLAISAANAVVWLQTASDRYILKLCALSRFHHALAVRTALVHWLAEAAQPVPAIQPSQQGEYQLLNAPYSVALHHWVDGSPLNASDPTQAHAAGAALARLHLTLARYPALADFAPLTAPARVASLGAELAAWLPTLSAKHTQLSGALDEIARRWVALDHADLPQGLAHNDYRAANLLFQGSDLRAILDFEELGWSYWVDDVAWGAVFLGTRYRDWGPLAPAVRAAFLTGYTAIRPLTAAEQTILPALLALGSIALARASQTPELQSASIAAAYDVAQEAGLLASG